MAGTIQRQAGKAPPKGASLWMQGLGCGALLTFAAPTMLVLGVLLAPAFASLLGERVPARGVARAVALCCAATAVFPIWHLWLDGDSMARALAELSDPATLVLSWGAGACAWALCQVLPVLLRSGWEAREMARARSIETRLHRTLEEWDIPHA